MGGRDTAQPRLCAHFAPYRARAPQRPCCCTFSPVAHSRQPASLAAAAAAAAAAESGKQAASSSRRIDTAGRLWRATCVGVGAEGCAAPSAWSASQVLMAQSTGPSRVDRSTAYASCADRSSASQYPERLHEYCTACAAVARPAHSHSLCRSSACDDDGDLHACSGGPSSRSLRARE